jgi:hypothetical protein
MLIKRGDMIVNVSAMVMGVISCSLGGDVGEVEETAEEHFF